ncbi:DUF202 domain-containing protein [Arthrobacter sp. B2a2-09]|uniref:DUF202 domain-containing protein n=1 Tax=Arthrobacter sp. B2a2-09 TaxID=2952822 RepID=UPI0022CD3690|nr:DUF202 domain-containing protein [Arthrobacter sp. B2a2-09]MCZ9884935.1 DUF202 domain-containing protein [Arthrobacter sp. B2a2-09]
MTPLFDPGLQPERTALAWRRTGLALLVASLASAKVLPSVVGPWSVLIGTGGVLGAIALLFRAQRRYRRLHRMLAAGGTPESVANGRLVATIALSVVIVGLVLLIAIVQMHFE